jgi:hypothetical protein
VIFMPNPYPAGPPADYGGAWGSLSRRTKLIIALLAPIPIVLGIAALILKDGTVAEFALGAAFLIWGSIGGYLKLVSDVKGERRRREKTQFHPLADAEVSAADRRDAMYDAQRKASIEAMKRRRGR